MKILAISGSLRAASTNTALLRLAARLSPAGATVELEQHLGDLPHFNPDLDDSAPEVVTAFRARIGAADGLLFCTPEYAHGLPGVLKNALDWLVSGAEFIDMPVAVLNASPRSTFADASLREILRTMSGHIVESASISLPLISPKPTAQEIEVNAQIAAIVKVALEEFVNAVGHSEPRRR